MTIAPKAKAILSDAKITKSFVRIPAKKLVPAILLIFYSIKKEGIQILWQEQKIDKQRELNKTSPNTRLSARIRALHFYKTPNTNTYTQHKTI
jgi:hypothetical protein